VALVRERLSTSERVRCGECGDDFHLSNRNARRHKIARTEPRCERCRFPARPLEPEERARLEAWGRERFSEEELVEMAGALMSLRL
jgi:hypothetical protein